MRPISYLLGLLLVLLISAIIFGISFELAPVDSDLAKASLAGVVTVAVVTSLSRLLGVFSLVDKFIDGIETGNVSRRGYKKRYLEYIYYRHRNFDVKGLSTQGTYTLELAQVFVELSMAPRAIHEVSAQLLDLPEELQTGTHSAWSYLREENGEYPNYAIIGPPGSGKTTLLKHIALAMVDNQAAGVQNGIPLKLPVLLFLRNISKAIAAENDEAPFTLEEAIQLDLRKRNAEAPGGWLADQLQKGDCLVMLDGLDEVADDKTRKKVVRWVERQLVGYARCPFLITSRPHGYRDNPLEGVTVLEVRPLNSDQQKRFVQNWYLANEIKSQGKDDQGVHLDAKEGANDLLRRLYTTPNLADLAINPLLLTMIATVHRYRSSLPGRRVELYAEIFEVFLGKRQQSKDIELELAPAQRQRVLQPVAWYMMEHELRRIDSGKAQGVIRPTLFAVSGNIEPELFLRTIVNESGLLLEREIGEYAFAHLTFQEYLAAAHARDQAQEHELLPRVGDSWWHETILLYAAQADASAIVEACLGEEGLPQLDALILAMECADEARELNEAARRKLDQILEETLEGDDEEQARLIAQVQLERRLKKMVRIDERRAIDSGLVTHAEYQLFLDHKRTAGENLQPDHWSETHYPRGTGNSPVVGVRPSDAERFCEWLAEGAAEEIVYRLPAGDEANEVPVEPLLSVEPVGYWVNSNGNPELKMAVGSPPAISSIILELYAAIARDLDHARERDRADLDCADRDHALTLARAIDHADRALALTRESDRADLDRARALDLDLARDRALDRADRERALNLDRVLDLSRDLSRYLARVDSARALDGALISARTRARADRARTFDRILNRKHDLALTLDDVRSFAALNAVDLLTILYEVEKESSWIWRWQEEYQEQKLSIIKAVDTFFELFVDLCILQERNENRLTAFEGIRLVRETVSQ